jgi:hypothetical protein
MADACIVCNKKIGFWDAPVPIISQGEEKVVHHECHNKFLADPEKYGGLPEEIKTETTIEADISDTSLSSEITTKVSRPPAIIEILSLLGWILFAMTGLAGVFLITQDGGGIFGASLIIAGVFQLSIFLGFSAIIDQLYQINQNTSQSDEDT